jgi:thiol peroxidase
MEKKMERTGIIDFKGRGATVVGPDLKVGARAPEFSVQTADWATIQALASTQGKVRVIGSLPSLSTDVCDRETRKFNEEAASLGDQVAILMVSMDLPWTIKNACAAAGIDRVVALSDHLDGHFGQKYGVLLKEPRIFRRAVFVVDQHDRVVYAEYTPAIGVEPNYAEVLAAVRRALTGKKSEER